MPLIDADFCHSESTATPRPFVSLPLRNGPRQARPGTKVFCKQGGSSSALAHAGKFLGPRPLCSERLTRDARAPPAEKTDKRTGNRLGKQRQPLCRADTGETSIHRSRLLGWDRTGRKGPERQATTALTRQQRPKDSEQGPHSGTPQRAKG